MLQQQLDPRSQAILRLIAQSYVTHGEAVGSRTLSQDLARLIGLELSPATIRNLMADLEMAGLLYAPHVSAGRLPTEAGLRLFVDRLLEIAPLDPTHQVQIAQQIDTDQPIVTSALEKLGTALSTLSQCAGLVAAPKKDRPLRQVEFVPLRPGEVLAIWVGMDGTVENRLLQVDASVTPSDLQQASNYLSYHLHGRNLADAKAVIAAEIAANRSMLNTMTANLVAQGLALAETGGDDGVLIVRGQAHLLQDIRDMDELTQVKQLFAILEQRETLLRLIEETENADGVQIFIGAQNTLFNHAGCAMIVAPYRNKAQQLIGAIGVVGPARMNYGRIIPLVDYTAKILSGV